MHLVMGLRIDNLHPRARVRGVKGQRGWSRRRSSTETAKPGIRIEKIRQHSRGRVLRIGFGWCGFGSQRYGARNQQDGADQRQDFFA